MSTEPKPPNDRAGADPVLDERLMRLESHVAQLERLVEELNQVVVGQSRHLHKLEQRHQSISSTLESFEMERIRSTNSKPPHSVL